jgi:hypothetical protein
MKPQDVVVILNLCLLKQEQTYAQMALALGLSASETHAAVRRLGEARLVDVKNRKVIHRSLCNFLIHGVPYAFPVQPGAVTLGMPTAWAAPVLKKDPVEDLPLPPVWPEVGGTVQGVSVQPLYANVPRTARLNSDLYDLLALVDVLRLDHAPERRRAGEEIFRRMTVLASA